MRAIAGWRCLRLWWLGDLLIVHHHWQLSWICACSRSKVPIALMGRFDSRETGCAWMHVPSLDVPFVVNHCSLAFHTPCPGAQCICHPGNLGLLLGNDPHRRLWRRQRHLSLRGAAGAALTAAAAAAAVAPRPHPRPHDHLCQRRRRHHPLRQRADRWRNVRLPSHGQRHVRGRRGPRALSDRRRALGRLPPRAPRRPDDLQALRRAGRLECQPRRSLHLRELRTALCCIHVRLFDECRPVHPRARR